MIYLRGVEPELRKKVWPFLLGLFPLDSTPEQQEAIASRASDDYYQTLGEWRTVEARNKEIEKKRNTQTNGFLNGSGEVSPCLSSISPTPSPTGSDHVSNGITANGTDSVSLESGSLNSKLLTPPVKLDAKGQWFVQELFNIDKDIPRCDRDYWWALACIECACLCLLWPLQANVSLVPRPSS